MDKQLRAFYDTLLEAAMSAKQKGEISSLECACIRALRFRPKKLRDAMQFTAEQLAVDAAIDASGLAPEEVGVAVANGVREIDWAKFFELVMKYLPAILQIIASFL